MKRSSCPSQRGFIPLKFGNQATKQNASAASVPHEGGVKDNCNISSTSENMLGFFPQAEADTVCEIQPPLPSPDDGHGGLAAKRSPFSLISKHQSATNMNGSLKPKPQIKCPPEELTSGSLACNNQ